MKRYHMWDQSAGYISREDEGLSLLCVADMSNWTEEEFEQISLMEIGDKLDSEGVVVQRTA